MSHDRKERIGRPDDGHGVPPSRSTQTLPPRCKWSLSLRLGLLTTLVVTGVMGVLSGLQLAFDIRADRLRQEQRLRASLAPLTAELAEARGRDEAIRAFQRFHTSYTAQGYFDHRVLLVDRDGKTLAEAGERLPHRVDRLAAAVPVVSAAFADGPLTLVVTQDGSVLSAERVQRWRAWGMHVIVTAAVTIALLVVLLRHEVTGPVDRLLRGIRSMERGYWHDMPDPGGAWELRWLGSRFRQLGYQLNQTVELLVAAQRRAFSDSDASGTANAPSDEAAADIEEPIPEPADRIRLSLLEYELDRLQAASPGDAEVRATARAMLDQLAPQAEQLGRVELRARLEDAALRVLDPDGFRAISDRIDADRPHLEALALTREAALREALLTRHVAVVDIQHRIKHSAGVWRKVMQKDLAVSQVHDLVALRIITRTEADCYHALGVVHDLYRPIVGRFKDYIAQPKGNGYRSLHLSVRDGDDAIFEVQIRSQAMHQHAEHGVAAHVGYKGPVAVVEEPPHRRLFVWLLRRQRHH